MKLADRVKFAAVLLAAAQLLFVLSSCAKLPGGEESLPAETVPETEDPAEGLPERSLDGYEWRVFMRGDPGNVYGARHKESFVTEYNGEQINDAVHDREIALSERYDFTIGFIPVTDEAAKFAAEYRQSVASGANEFDVGIASSDYVSPVVLDGSSLPWNELDDVDLTHPWWNRSAIEGLTVGGVAYYALGDLTFDLMDYTYLLYFNKELCRDYGMEEEALYDTVLAGRWTLSALYTKTKDVYRDVNANGAADENDLYGLTVNSLSGQAIFQNAADALTTEKDTDGVPHIIESTERLTGLVERMYALMYMSEGTFVVDHGYFGKGWWLGTSHKMVNGQTLFSTGLFYELFTGEYAGLDFDMGFLPLPKYDAAQDGYHTTCDYGGPFAVVPKTADVSRAGFCAEAVAAYGRAIVTPAYYETTLKHRYADTDKDAQMIDLIVNGITFDLYNVTFTTSPLQSVIYDRNANFASWWQKNERTMRKRFDGIVGDYLRYSE